MNLEVALTQIGWSTMTNPEKIQLVEFAKMIGSPSPHPSGSNIGQNYQAIIPECDQSDSPDVGELAYYVNDPTPSAKIPIVKKKPVQGSTWLVKRVVKRGPNSNYWVEWYPNRFSYDPNNFVEDPSGKFPWLYKGKYPIKSYRVTGEIVTISWPISLANPEEIPPVLLVQLNKTQENKVTTPKKTHISHGVTIPHRRSKRKIHRTDVYVAIPATAKWSTSNDQKKVKLDI